MLGGVGLLMKSGYPANLHKSFTTEGTYKASGDIVHVFSSDLLIGQLVYQISLNNTLVGMHFRISVNGGTNWDDWYGISINA